MHVQCNKWSHFVLAMVLLNPKKPLYSNYIQQQPVKQLLPRRQEALEAVAASVYLITMLLTERNFDTTFSYPAGGGDPILWPWLIRSIHQQVLNS